MSGSPRREVSVVSESELPEGGMSSLRVKFIAPGLVEILTGALQGREANLC